MLPVQHSFPFFEANQVLSNEHLNQLFAYLDEQERLTRANLIGIGIVCGLEADIAASGAFIRLSRGCGVTSEGYLAVWDDPGPLEFYKPYTLPDDVRYDTFLDDHDNNPATPVQQFPLWELTPDKNNDPTALALNLNFLTGNNMPPAQGGKKILVLFLECLAEDNKNCSPNSCDDKGKMITATLRPLLMREADVLKMRKKIEELGAPATDYDNLMNAQAATLNLPELRLRRYDVPASVLVKTADVFEGFQSPLSPAFVQQVSNALTATYNAFKPLVGQAYPNNPFAGLAAAWAYLHNGGIVSQGKYLWYQYYYDHLDTVLQAYNEFRENGLNLIGLCCPDSRIFPRHLLITLAVPGAGYGGYRSFFAPSPLFSRLYGAFQDLLVLFRRLVEIIGTLELPPQVGGPNLSEIKITPSKLGAFPLSAKAIPYHYRPVPLFQWWSAHKAKRQQEKYNLGYRAAAWNNSDDFVLNPLRYDFEPNNFLRIEGHIGRSFQLVLEDLLAQKKAMRLPIEIVALKTGRNSNNINVDYDIDKCHFNDLEALYDALKEELLCHLCEIVQHLYGTILRDEKGQDAPGGPKQVPQFELLQNCAPLFRYTPGTVGASYENMLPVLATIPYADINPQAASPFLGVINLWITFLQGDVPTVYLNHLVYIYYAGKVAETLTDNLNDLNLNDFANKYGDLKTLARLGSSNLQKSLGDINPEVPSQTQVDVDEFQDQIDMFLSMCKLDPIQSVYEEMKRRIQRLRDNLLFSKFIQQHPGIQHKAGVPLGGTFIVVYHGEEQSTGTQTGKFTIRGRVIAGNEPIPGAIVSLVSGNAGAVTNSNGSFTLSLFVLPSKLRMSIPGFDLVDSWVYEEDQLHIIDLLNPTDNGPDLRFSNLQPGLVIADFYLPYLCCSDCEPIQFVLPKLPPSFAWVQQGCSFLNAAGGIMGPVLITPQGGTAPYEYSTNGGQTWLALPDTPVTLQNQGQVIIRDAEQTPSAPRTIQLAPELVVKQEPANPPCNTDGTEHSAVITVNGGIPPYKIQGQTLPAGQNALTLAFPSGQGGQVTVSDSANPPCVRDVLVKEFVCAPACDLPCNGRAMDCAYLLWLQPPTDQIGYKMVQLNVESLFVSGETSNNGDVKTYQFDGEELNALTEALNPASSINTMSQFHATWMSRIPEANQFMGSRLSNAFPASPFPGLNWSYNPEEPGGGIAALRIEYFKCHDFAFTIRVEYDDTAGNRFVRISKYTPSGVAIRILSADGKLLGEAQIPPMACFLRDHCNDKKEEALCTKPSSIKMEILDKTGLNIKLGLTPTPTASDQVFWDFEAGTPAVSNASIGETTFPQAGNYRVNVLVVGKDTCVSTHSMRVGVEGRLGNPPVTGGGVRPRSAEAPKVDKKSPAGKKSAAAPKKTGKASAPKKRKDGK